MLPTEAVSRTRVPADEQRTVEVTGPRGRNPLAPSEIARVKQVADSSAQIKSARERAAGTPRPPRLRQLLDDVPVLYAQRHNEDKNDDLQTRKADVFYYNYTTNEAIRVVTDPNRNAVLETHVAKGVTNQPFFSSAEVKAALQLVFEHPELGSRLQTSYLNITGHNLNDISLLEAQGGIFFPDSAAHTPLEDIAAVCAVDRCMQLFITIDDARFIDMSDLIVNLSTGEVLSGGEAPSGHTH
ncbi:hypothetical protein [Candidatus Methylobacter favarea]|uniref:hypothetical protein n=1 Tax=Candidatus Methylobacter favarea TaxID=2707345 RepID=UPI001C2DCE70|nr:hypothetical protein [Candidatus Methylobacter favarea]